MGRTMNRDAIQVFLIVILVALTFGRSVNNGFVWDDERVIQENPLFDGSRAMPDILAAEDSIPGSGKSTGYYRPLTYMSFYLDSLVWEGDPSGFHATSLALHILVALTLYAFLVSLGSASLPALMGTLLFALNPVASETVCFVSGGRNTLLCALCALLCLVAHRHGRTLLAVLCTLGAAAAKEPGFLLPLALVCHDRILAGGKRSWRDYLPHLAPLFLLLAVRWLFIGTGSEPPQITAKIFLLAPELVLRYLWIVVVPFFHKTAYTVGMSVYVSGFALLAVAGFGVAAVVNVKRWDPRPEAFGIAWFLIFLVPSLLPAVLYKISMADRHAYLPALGLAMGVTFLLGALPARRQLILVTPLIIAFAGFSFSATGVWHDNGTLFSRMVEDDPRGETGHTSLSMHYLKSGEIDKALQTIDRGEAAGGVAPRVAMNIRLSLLTSHGEAMVKAGRDAEAETVLREALRINSDFVPALIDMGGVAARGGDPGSAIRYFTRAAELQPGNPVPHFNLAETYRIRGDVHSAEKEMQEFRRLGGE